ncbi:unnamed protein product, partial [Meganyctiphanes norvegica]
MKMRKKMFTIILMVVQLGLVLCSEAPRFLREPPQNAVFTNTTGIIIDCLGEGGPTPRVSWIKQDGRPMEEVSGLVRVLNNGSLEFSPFPGVRYNPRLHEATYTCVISSSAGGLRANPTQVRAVVVGDYEVQVYDQLVMAGNTAVLRCSVPSYVRDYVTVTSWIRDDTFNIYPNMHG